MRWGILWGPPHRSPVAPGAAARQSCAAEGSVLSLGSGCARAGYAGCGCQRGAGVTLTALLAGTVSVLVVPVVAMVWTVPQQQKALGFEFLCIKYSSGHCIS